MKIVKIDREPLSERILPGIIKLFLLFFSTFIVLSLIVTNEHNFQNKILQKNILELEELKNHHQMVRSETNALYSYSGINKIIDERNLSFKSAQVTKIQKHEDDFELDVATSSSSPDKFKTLINSRR